MKGTRCRFIGTILTVALVLSIIPLFKVDSLAASGTITDANGWFESAYTEWSAVNGADGYSAYLINNSSSDIEKIDDELIRSYGTGYRVDAVGLAPGEYRIKIVPKFDGKEDEAKAIITNNLSVMAYDRSGFAHFNYTEGVGAYNDDGTLKDDAIVLYVTEANKNTVSVTSKDGTTVRGIGNILGSTGMDVGDGMNSKGGKANTNSDILRKLAKDGTPLVVRIIGRVSGVDIDGLSAYNSVDYGGSVGDNGYMARMSGGKDITIEGIGNDAVIDGWGLHFICQTADYKQGYGKSFEVRNISFKNVPEDCVGMEGQQEGKSLNAPVERCWIHHCSFYAPYIPNPAESDKSGGDGACDFKRGMYFTNSYCYYEGYHKTNLVGSSDDSLQYHITYHHNYWKECESRGPLARQANIHMYNNIFEGQRSYCMNPRANAYIFSEYNMFLNSKNPVTVVAGGVKSYNDSFTSCIGENSATVVSDKNDKVSTANKYANFDTDANLSYIPSGNYDLQESISEMKAVVMAYAGPQKENIVFPDEVNISLIPENRKNLSAVVLPYNNELNKSYISASGIKDNILFNPSKFNSDSLSIGNNSNGVDIVFYVNTSVNIEMTAISGSYLPVLCNEAGESFIVGSGSAECLPAGYYFIQSTGYDVGSGKFKEAKISGLKIIQSTICEEHSYTQKVTKPTCTASGHTAYTCTLCGYSFTADITAPLGHTPGAASTCTVPESCEVCGVILSPVVPHNYADGKCEMCGKNDPAICYHTDISSKVTPPTCTEPGYTTFTCKLCNYTYTGAATDPKGHIPGTAATCTNAQYCTVCKETIKEPLGHIFKDGICTVCGAENLSEKGYAHSFTESGTASDFYTISGNLSSSKGEIVYEGLTLTKCLKIESSTSIVFVAPKAGKLTLVFGGNLNAAGKKIVFDGIYYTIDATQILTLDISEGTHSIAKGDSINLFYIVYSPESESVHTHNYESYVTTPPKCTESGIVTFTCSCGDSYSEQIPATGHNYTHGVCTNCGDDINPPKPAYVASFTGVSMYVGKDFSMNFYVTPDEGEKIGDYSVRFTVEGKEAVTVTNGVYDNGRIIFTLPGIAPQYMATSITAELICRTEVINTKNYSIKQYAVSLIGIYSGDENTVLRRFISDILYYGAAVQKHIGYRTDELVTDGIENILEPSNIVPTANDKETSIITISGADTSNGKFTAVGVRVDVLNRIYVKFSANDAKNVKITVNGNELAAVPTSNGMYTAYLQGIGPLNFDTEIFFALKYNGNLVQILRYTVNTYSWEKSGDPSISELAIAMYRYGKSAEDYKVMYENR